MPQPRTHRECIVAQWRRTLRAAPGGRMLARLLLPKSNAGIALRISLAGTASLWLTALLI